VRTHLDLFSGIGGFALAAGWAGFTTVGFVEYEDFPKRLLSRRFPGIPIHSDIHDFDATPFRGVDLVTGGFPCQPFSAAGKQRGKEDDRWLWKEMLRVVVEAQPTWVLAENVAGLINMALDEVLLDLEAEDYATATVILPACAKNALHIRQRCWIIAKSLAHSKCQSVRDKGSGQDASDTSSSKGELRERQRIRSDPSECSKDVAHSDSSGMERSRSEQQTAGASRAGEDVAHSEIERTQGLRPSGFKEPPTYAGQEVPLCRYERIGSSYWETEPAVGRVADGIPNRVDRLKGLGNAIVPQVAYEIIRHFD
jgi:DNA (cytosine-5)-methyltransferase 1